MYIYGLSWYRQQYNILFYLFYHVVKIIYIYIYIYIYLYLYLYLFIAKVIYEIINI